MINLWIWVGIAVTLATWSFLYKDSALFRWAETTYIAAAVGHQFIVGIYALRDRYALITAGRYLLIIPAIMGFMYFFVLWRKRNWVASYPIAISMGVGLARQVTGSVASDIIGQLLGILGEAGRIVGASATTAFTNILRIAITTLSLVYFTFTLRPKGSLGKVYDTMFTLGQYCLMAAFGAMTGNLLQGKLAISIATITRLILGALGAV